VSDRPAPNSTRSRQAAKRFRRRGRRLARRLLDEAYADYLRGLTLLNNNNNNNSNTNSNDNYSIHDNSNISMPSSPPPLPPLSSQFSPQPSPSLHQVPSPPRSPTLPVIEPDSPHSAITSRILPDSPPPSVRSFSPPSYSPISSSEPPRPISPANSTSSVEFIDEIRIPSARLRHYYYYDPLQLLDNLILQFPQRTTPLSPGFYFIGLDDFDLSEIRSAISGQNRPTLLFPSSSLFPSSLMKYQSVSFSTFSHLQQPLPVK